MLSSLLMLLKGHKNHTEHICWTTPGVRFHLSVNVCDGHQTRRSSSSSYKLLPYTVNIGNVSPMDLNN